MTTKYSHLRRFTALAAASIALAIPGTAWAEGPEELEQLEPEGGELQIEYFGQIGSTSDAEREHAFEANYGLTDNFIIGGEVEAEVEDGKMIFESAGLSGLYKFSEAEGPGVGLGVKVAANIDRHGKLSQVESRFILAKSSDDWWGQANVMLRHVRGEDDKGELLAYSWSLQHAVAKNVWFGVEGSGQAARLGGFAVEGFEKAHYMGPSLTLELEPAENRELELGLTWQRHLGDNGPRNTIQIFAQFTFGG